MTHMQGIVSILGSDNPEKTTTAPSLRRTLSADMSYTRVENGLSFNPVMRKIASSEQIAIDSLLSSEEDEDECEVNGNGNPNGNGDEKNPRRIDIWTAIMSQKAQDNSVNLPPPYVHPLVKKSSSLSEKSLTICTESLGSETGSDVFSSYPSSETADENQVPEVQEEYKNIMPKEADGKEYNKDNDNDSNKVVRHACLTTKKAQHTRSFPPPLPSLATVRTDCPSLHMHSHRIDGRLVVEAVSVPQQKYFEAQRQDGRFLLTLINNPTEQPPPESNLDNKTKHEKEDEMESNFDNETGILNPRPPNLKSMAINIQKPIKRMMKRDNENLSWSRKLNTRITKLEVVEEEEAPPTPISRSAGLPPLPPPPPPQTATSMNSYQYFWKAKPTVASVIDPLITQHRPPTKNKDLVLVRGNKADCFLPSLKGCKEPRRSILMWEPFCIATS